jgi:hypothetical protein
MYDLEKKWIHENTSFSLHKYNHHGENSQRNSCNTSMLEASKSQATEIGHHSKYFWIRSIWTINVSAKQILMKALWSTVEFFDSI